MTRTITTASDYTIRGDADRGWTLFADGEALFYFETAEELSCLHDALDGLIVEAHEAEAAAQAQVDEDERRHQREECTFTTSGAW